MKEIAGLEQMRAACAEIRRSGSTLGFVPTMGYLHDGHLALVERARAEADVVVASIYVNPTQFAPGEDLATYPRDPDGDRAKLEAAGCEILFLPKSNEIYPDDFSTYVVMEEIFARYEGAFRPTHFRGVATIVAKLFNIVGPDVAVFGQKDAQQVAVIRRMIRDLSYGIRLAVVETIRDPDGLAMSSRNVYLSPEERQEALSISAALRAGRECISTGADNYVALEQMRATLSPSITPDYIDIIDPETFDHAANRSGPLLGIFAGRVGRTRLIDNMRLDGGG